MTNHIFTDVIQQLKAASDRQLGVIDAEGDVVACSDAEQVGVKLPKLARVVALSEEQAIHFSGKTVQALSSFGGSFDFAVFVDGEDDLANSLCVMAQVALNCTKIYYEEKHDKATFVKNIITDNILPGDIYIRAKELHFPADQYHVVLLVRQQGTVDVGVVDVLQSGCVSVELCRVRFDFVEYRDSLVEANADVPIWLEDLTSRVKTSVEQH